MAFFDSPKNRALWDREAATLRPEREARAATGFMPAKKREVMMDPLQSSPNRERINFQQLEKIVKEERNMGGKAVSQASAQRTRTVEKAPPSKSAQMAR